jgi:hypothetical protein
MPELAEKLEPQPLPDIKRFNIADLSEHGPWIMARLLKAFPNQNERSMIGWLNGVIDNNEFLCLVMPDAVCFAERVAADRLSNKLVVREIFVWCQDPDNVLHVRDAAEFYPRMADWAKHQGIDKVIVCEKSDVPIEEVRKKFTRLHEIKTVFARV